MGLAAHLQTEKTACLKSHLFKHKDYSASPASRVMVVLGELHLLDYTIQDLVAASRSLTLSVKISKAYMAANLVTALITLQCSEFSSKMQDFSPDP